MKNHEEAEVRVLIQSTPTSDFRCSVVILSSLQEAGGYFVINGNERIIRMLIMPRRNYVSTGVTLHPYFPYSVQLLYL